MEITLAKAMKVKNRLVRRFQEVQSKISSNNSYYAQNPAKVPVAQFVTLYNDLRQAIIGVKTAISVANVPIFGILNEMAEKKASIQFWRSVSTFDGVQNGYERDITYIAQVKEAEVDLEVSQLNDDIEALQDKLDELNHTTKVSLKDEWLKFI